MESRELTILERIARNLPARKMNFGVSEQEFGPVYLAWGKDNDGTFHGVWGFRGVARIMEFTKNSTVKGVKQLLLDDAANFYYTGKMVGYRFGNV